MEHPMDFIKFIHQKPTPKEIVGVPLAAADDRVMDLKAGHPYVIGHGMEISLPRQAYDTYCHAEMRGVLFVPKKGGLKNILKIFSDPKRHPEVMAGVERSKNVRHFKKATSEEIFCWHNLQETKSLLYVTLMTGRRFDHGLTFTQLSLPEAGAQKYLERNPNRNKKETDNLRNFVGQIQVLEVANGTLIISELTADFAKPPIIGCQTAADSQNALFLPDFLGADEAVRQRIEQRLRLIAKAAFPN